MTANYPWWRSIKTRVTVFMLVIFVLSIWSLAFYASRVLREDMQQLLGEQQFSTASIIAAQLNEELGERLRVLETIAREISPAMMGNPALVQRFLKSQLVLQDHFNSGNVVFDAQSTAIADFPEVPGRVGVTYGDLSIVRAALDEGKSSFGKPILSKTSSQGNPIIGFGAPIRDAQGRAIGVLAGVTDLGKPNFLDEIAHGKYGKTGGYLLVAPQYRLIITASDRNLIMQPLPARGVIPWVDRAVDGYEGSAIYVTQAGVEVLSSVKRIPVSGWNVVTRMPTAEAFAPISAMQQRVILGAILLTLLAGGLTWWMLRRELAPMVLAANALTNRSDDNQPVQPLPVTSEDEFGELVGGFNRLLTTIAQRENALQMSESRLARAMDATSDGLWEWDLATGQGYFSPAYYRMLGYEEGEFANTVDSWLERIHPEDRERALAANQDCIEGRVKSFSTEFRMRAKNGGWRWILGRGKAVTRDASGKALLMIGTHVDISERKRAEEDLQQQKNLLNTIFDSSSEAIFAKDTDGRYRFINQAGADMLGYKTSEIVGRTDFDLLPNEIAREFQKTDEQVMSGGQVYEREESGVIDGRPFTFQASKSPWRDNSGTIVGVIGISKNITAHRLAEMERARLEAQLRESQKMEALGTLAGGVAHDFNNALAMILGNVELARQDIGSDHPALVSLDEISKASRRAKDLVQQILAFSRRQKMERKPMSLALVVVETARLVRASLPAMVSMNVKCEGDAPAVLADATQMEQVLLNLCSNAAYAVQDIGRPGVIDVHLSGHDCTQGKIQGDLLPGRYACLTVRDNGRGMDEETRSRIFDPFFTTKPAGKGTGLGLSVVHGIAQAHEARIVVESTPGEGSTFRIYFPAFEGLVESVATPAPEATPVHGQGKHVLYLDDEEAIIFLMKRLLERKGYRVTGFTDPKKALEAVQADPDDFDLAVTDYYMPGMSGLEVAQALQKIRPDLPMVMASGYITEDLRAKAPGVGIRELIYKPNTVEDLCEAVARFANTQQKMAS